MKEKKFIAPKICFLLFLLCFIILILQYSYLSLSKKVYGIDMKKFALNRNTVTSTIVAKRGTIYDIFGNTLAQNVSSYTLIAYLDPNRTVSENNPQHVVDKEYTATKLSKILGEDYYNYILSRLNSNSKQVEFGKVGKGLTELTKLAIEDLDLPGIDFVESVKRYYPNGDFLSYIIGYAKQYEKITLKINDTYDLYKVYKNYFENYENVTIQDYNEKIISVENTTIKALKKGNCFLTIKTNNDPLATIYINVIEDKVIDTVSTAIIGELGIEGKFNYKLTGIDGYTSYQQDKYGYKIPDTPEETNKAIDGYDIYLTIDSNIQRFAENAVNKLEEKNPDFSIISVMDAKTGSILASATTPSFNPNSLSDDMSYQNPLVSYNYEPGSVMKIYTYMCAIETGLYDGSKTYLSGSYEFDDGTIMHDFNQTGWGTLTYDQGLSYSSNIAIINIIKDYLSREKLRSCLDRYGFGKKTGIELSNESNGNLDFKYETEVMSAGFGQGISITAIQQLQALSIIANDGVMVKPHIIDKIVNSDGETTITEIVKSKKLVDKKVVLKIRDLMESVVSPDSVTGKGYYMEGYDLIGKTGTAQIYENGAYLEGDNDYIASVALMYPKDDPKIIIYAVSKRPEGPNTALIEPIKELIKNINKYKSLNTDSNDKREKYILKNYTSKTIEYATKELNENKVIPVVIGSGTMVIDQYPKSGVELINNDKVFLITNNTEYKIKNFIGWSKSDVKRYCSLVNLKCNFDGIGYVFEQSIEEGTLVSNDLVLELKFENKIE